MCKIKYELIEIEQSGVNYDDSDYFALTECGSVGCKEWCLEKTDWCKNHQYKEQEEVGFLLPNKIAELI